MKEYSGSKKFPIWLIGDSPPEALKHDLAVPFDSRHPTRHSIWTPIENIIQRELFISTRGRFRSEDVYVINALGDVRDKEKSAGEWSRLSVRMNEFRAQIDEYQPKVILTFGQFSFEFMRRVLCQDKTFRPESWTCEKLGQKFVNSMEQWSLEEPNLIPLLHATIARGKFLRAHKLFCPDECSDPNYFEFVGVSLATKIEKSLLKEPIWL